jgi:hypothetical protein
MKFGERKAGGVVSIIRPKDDDKTAIGNLEEKSLWLRSKSSLTYSKKCMLKIHTCFNALHMTKT